MGIDAASFVFVRFVRARARRVRRGWGGVGVVGRRQAYCRVSTRCVLVRSGVGFKKTIHDNSKCDIKGRERAPVGSHVFTRG